MCKTVTNIALLFSVSLPARLNIVTAAAAGLQETDCSMVQPENRDPEIVLIYLIEDRFILLLTNQAHAAVSRKEQRV